MLTYYNAMLSMQPSSQKERYLEEEQAFIDREFSNSTTINTIQEESVIGSFLFNDIDVRLTHVVSDVTTGTKDGDDFRLILFQDLKKIIVKGLYYIFNNNYWLATFTDSSEAKKVIVRRCNNTMVDMVDGNIIKYPCVLGYDASAFNPYISQSIITPSNTIMIIVQGNDYTRSLKVNRRFLFNGRPFKIVGYNNYMENNMLDKQVDMIMFDLQLDTIDSRDDFENSIAYNGTDIIVPIPIPIETTIILPQVTEIMQGRTINLNAYLSVNGIKTTNPITCVASGVPMANFTLVQVDDENFTLTNNLNSATPLILTFTTIYNSITITNAMSIILRARF